MRIDLTNTTASQVSGELSSQQAGSQKAAFSGQSDTEDRTTLTSGSTYVDSLVHTALSSPEVRQDTVDSLRLAVTSGQYDIDPARIAAAMVDEHA